MCREGAGTAARALLPAGSSEPPTLFCRRRRGRFSTPPASRCLRARRIGTGCPTMSCSLTRLLLGTINRCQCNLLHVLAHPQRIASLARCGILSACCTWCPKPNWLQPGKGFLTTDFSKRDEFSLTLRAEQHRQQIKARCRRGSPWSLNHLQAGCAAVHALLHHACQ